MLKRWLFQVGWQQSWAFVVKEGVILKNQRTLHCVELNSIQPSTKILRQNIATVPRICFILATITPNLVSFWTIYPLKLMFSTISASCVTWIGQTPSYYYNHNNANNQCNQQKRKNAKILGQNEQRVQIWVMRLGYEWREQKLELDICFSW